MICTHTSVTPEYYLYEMTDREVDAFVNQINIKLKNDWERTRTVATSFGGELKLPWDPEEEIKQEPLTQEELRTMINSYNQKTKPG